MPAADLPDWLLGRTFRCAWCARQPIAGGLLYYTRRLVDEAVIVLAAAAAEASGSDGICPAHLAAVRDRVRPVTAPRDYHNGAPL